MLVLFTSFKVSGHGETSQDVLEIQTLKINVVILSLSQIAVHPPHVITHKTGIVCLNHIAVSQSVQSALQTTDGSDALFLSVSLSFTVNNS